MGSSLQDRLQEDLNLARKARDKLRTLVLSATLPDAQVRQMVREELAG